MFEQFDVKGDNLHDANEELKKYPFTSDYPDYHPHLTIGYLKPNKGKKYVDILKHNLLPVCNENYIFQQDNDPKHTALKTSIFLINNNIKTLVWCPNSPDLNPIENKLCKYMKIFGCKAPIKPLLMRLEEGGWKEVYRDSVAVIYQKE